MIIKKDQVAYKSWFPSQPQQDPGEWHLALCVHILVRTWFVGERTRDIKWESCMSVVNTGGTMSLRDNLWWENSSDIGEMKYHVMAAILLWLWTGFKGWGGGNNGDKTREPLTSTCVQHFYISLPWLPTCEELSPWETTDCLKSIISILKSI